MRYKGFTIVEFIIVIAIISIIVTVGFLNFPKLYKIYKFNEYVVSLEYLVNWAKIKAIEQGKHIAICVKNKKVIVVDKGTERNNACPEQNVIRELEINENWIEITQTRNILLWDSRGFSVFNGNICISDSDRYYKLKYQTNRSIITKENGNGRCL